MAFVVVDKNESIEKALRRFKKKVQKEDIMKDIKKSSVQLTPGEKKRLKEAKARKRMRRRMRRKPY